MHMFVELQILKPKLFELMDSISLKPLPPAYRLSTIPSHPLLHISQKRNAISETYLVFPE